MSVHKPTAVNEDEHAAALGTRALSRRRMLSLAGAGVASLGLEGCDSRPLAHAFLTSPASANKPNGHRAPIEAPSTPPASANLSANVTVTRPAATLPILKTSGQSTNGSSTTQTGLDGGDAVWHLLRRATYGPTWDLVVEVNEKGPAAWIDQQLQPYSIDDSACDAYLARYPALNMTTEQIRASYPTYSGQPNYELQRATIARALWSKRQLLEVMVEFWSNHFNVSLISEVWDLKTTEDREAIRENALGSFSGLLKATAKSPAMLRFLDNDGSSKDTLNENYGRELLELHTVGLQAEYTQMDVVSSARIMTGFTVDNHGEFEYRPDRHYVGPVSVLSFNSPNDDSAGGLQVAEAYLDYLAHHPATARQLALKLAVRFVSDAPSDALVDSLSDVYLANDTSISPLLRALLTSPEFRNSVGTKTKRPFEDVVGLARALRIAPAAGGSQSLENLLYTIRHLGQAPFEWGPPNGFPDDTASWLSTATTLGRWNAHLGLAQGWWKDGMSSPPLAELLDERTPVDNAGLLDTLTRRLTGGLISEPQRSAAASFMDWLTRDVKQTVSWHLDYVVALVTGSPWGVVR